MPIFELTPNNINLPDWEASTHRGPCRVYAPDSLSARRFAQLELINKAVEGQYRGQRKIFCPWTDQSLVRCKQIPGDSPAHLPEGFVMLPGKHGWDAAAALRQGKKNAPAPPAKATRPPAVSSGNGSDVATEAANGSAVDTTGDHDAGRAGAAPASPDITARVIQNKDLLAYQAQGLMAVLDEIGASEPIAESGVAKPQSRASDGDLNDDLIDLLRQLRGELGGLNAVLQGAPIRKPKIAPVLTGFRTSANAASNSVLGRCRNGIRNIIQWYAGPFT